MSAELVQTVAESLVIDIGDELPVRVPGIEAVPGSRA
jgi:hypothetical protein